MIQTIVAGVDGSANSFAALTAAARLAERTGSRLKVVFVHDPGVAHSLATAYEGTAEPILERTLTELEATSHEHALTSSPARQRVGLIDATTTEGASLIVVGGHGHSVLGGLILGSVAQKLVRSSPISVLVVRHPAVDGNPVARLQRSAP